MKKAFLLFLTLNLVTLAAAISGPSAAEINGAALYKKHCANCHPHADKLKTETYFEIIESMRNPPPSMPSFEDYKISDIEASAIASYVQYQIVSKFDRKTT